MAKFKMTFWGFRICAEIIKRRLKRDGTLNEEFILCKNKKEAASTEMIGTPIKFELREVKK